MGIESISSAGHQRRGFTLIEMLVVVAIIGIILAVAVPSFFGAIGASRLTQGGDQLLGVMSQAQETAISAGRPLEVRFYKIADADTPGGAGEYRAIMVLEYFSPGQDDPRVDINPALAGVKLTAPMALARQPMLTLPGGVAMSENSQLSTLISATSGAVPSGNTAIQSYVRRGAVYEALQAEAGATYKSFVFYPESTSLDAAQKWFVTLVDTKEIDADPAVISNFYTIQIEPTMGRLSVFRP